MAEPETERNDTHVLYQRVRDITRQLHSALRALGHDERLQASLGRMPDAKARLSFIARLTGEAAERVLDTVDAAQARQAALADEAARIEALLAGADLGPAGEAMRQFAADVRTGAQATSAQLTDIMLAQDFHDLTGQTVRKVVEVATGLEQALVALLLETAPALPAQRGPLEGPVADAAGRTDVVADQAQVDDLLESLGF